MIQNEGFRLSWLFIIGPALGFLTSGAPWARGDITSSEPIGVASPDGRCRIELLVGKVENAAGAPMVRVDFKGRPVLLPSPVQIELADGARLGSDTVVESSTTAEVQSEFRQHPGKRSRVVDRCREVVIHLRERTAPSRRWQIVLRAYDDGVAFRYRLPAQEGWPSLVLSDERVVLNLPDDAIATALPLNGFTTSYEKRYEKKLVRQLPGDWLLGLPLLLELPGTGWLALAEADLTDYAGMYLAPAAGTGSRPGQSGSRLVPDEPKVAVRAALPHESPWRVFMIADRLERLVESDLVLNLNAPCALDDISWIKPGKTTFPWWNGFHEEKVPFKMGLNTATAKYYIDFCAEAGIPYHSLDGLDNSPGTAARSSPTRGPTSPGASTASTSARSCAYAASKGVKIRLWMHWQAAEAHMERAFPLYREWGVEGVMLDFMDRDDQEMVNFLRRALRDGRREPADRDAPRRGRADRAGADVPEPADERRRAEPGIRQVGQAGRHARARADRPVHADARRPARLPPGLAPRRAAWRRSGPGTRPRWSWGRLAGCSPPTSSSRTICRWSADYPSAYRGHPALPVLAPDPDDLGRHPLPGRRVGEFIVIARRRASVVGRRDDRSRGTDAENSPWFPRPRALPCGAVPRRAILEPPP